MAVRYAVANGNWSDTATWDGGTLPTSDDDVFANNFTVTIDQDVTVLSIRNTSNTSPAVTAGGSFLLSDNYSITCTSPSGIIAGSSTCIQYIGTVIGTINSNVISSNTSNVRSVVKTGNGVLNFNGNLTGNANNALTVNSNTGILNFIGDIIKDGNNISTISIFEVNSGGNTINITGNISCNLVGGGNNKKAFESNGNNTINITGNISGQNLNAVNTRVLTLSSGDICNITGSIFGVNTTSTTTSTIYSTTANYLKITGIIQATGVGTAIINTSTSSISVFSGPFIFGSYGSMPFRVASMFLSNNTSNYIEFADDSTNGALFPSAAPTRETMYSPNTLADSPPQSDVRDGVVYALNSQTGTLKVPPPSTVMLGVPTDNTTGTGIFTPDSLFDSILNETHPIAKRLKNVATVDTTGAQISSN